jgi:hypothetical protein
MTATTAQAAVLAVAYDLRGPVGRESANRHRSYWGKLYTDIHTLALDHVVLVFRPDPDERWREWERVRAQWIMEELAA